MLSISFPNIRHSNISLSDRSFSNIRETDMSATYVRFDDIRESDRRESTMSAVNISETDRSKTNECIRGGGTAFRCFSTSRNNLHQGTHKVK